MLQIIDFFMTLVALFDGAVAKARTTAPQGETAA